jgi:hypothetical protein
VVIPVVILLIYRWFIGYYAVVVPVVVVSKSGGCYGLHIGEGG